MNMIDVQGGTAVKRELAFNAAAWYINKYMPRMRTLDIEIHFKKLKTAWGFCMEAENNRCFDIEIESTLTGEDLIATVIHEMIHVKQFARRELQYKGNKTRWKSKWFGDINYDDQPWEKEAHKYDVILTKEFLKDNK